MAFPPLQGKINIPEFPLVQNPRTVALVQIERDERIEAFKTEKIFYLPDICQFEPFSHFQEGTPTQMKLFALKLSFTRSDLESYKNIGTQLAEGKTLNENEKELIEKVRRIIKWKFSDRVAS